MSGTGSAILSRNPGDRSMPDNRLDPADLAEFRYRLLNSGYAPVPIINRGKQPPMEGWEKLLGTNRAEIELWTRLFPDSGGTGLLCRYMPALDIDILNPEAAEAVEALVRERFEEKGRVLVRIGLAPKRAIPFRASIPFKKISASLIAPNGDTKQKLEFLGDGQQLVAFGLHEKTGQPYRWFGDEPGDVKLCELPYIEQADAHRLFEDALALINREHGYRTAPTRKRKAATGNGQDTTDAGGADDWAHLLANIHNGRELHDSLCRLAAKMVTSSTNDGAVVNHLRGLMDASSAPHDQRWQDRRADIPRLVASAAEKFRKSPTEPGESAPPQSDGDPVDLWGHFEPPTLPRSLLPEKIENYAFAQAETMGVDPGGIAMAALAVCAGAIPDGIKLMMKPHSGELKKGAARTRRYSGGEWMESARLWVGLVGLPSTKKSPIITATVGPLARLDTELLQAFLSEMRDYEKLDKEERKETEKPVQTRLRLEDTTIEAAQEVLAGSPNGVLLVQDELSGFFGSMDKYSGYRGAAKDRGFWLQSYNGGQYALNRVTRGVGIIPNLSVSLLGGIQPEVIRQLSTETYDDGFLQRMLLIVMRPASVGAATSTPDVAMDYAELVERLTKHGDGVLRLISRAQDIRGALEVRHLDLVQAIETFNGKLAAHIGKYDGLFGRLCVTFHCIEHAHHSRIPEFVTAETAERVAKFMHQFLLPHAFAFYSGVLRLADDHDRLVNVAGYILTRGMQRLTNRDVQAGCRTMRKLERHDIEAVFEQLDALGWVTRTPGPRLTDPPHWIVNPVVHVKFAERARVEAERRQRVRAIITGMRQGKC